MQLKPQLNITLLEWERLFSERRWTNRGEDMEEREFLHTVGWNIS
jgi:hypothetical protein